MRRAAVIGRWAGLLALLACGSAAAQPPSEQEYGPRRAAMVADIERDARAVADALGKAALDAAVMAAMARVPRHAFVPAHLREHAYVNRPLPIGNGQTISQPFIVALMSDLAAIDGDAVVLEVGTGSGYQAAVLAELAAEVYTVEIIAPLGRQAAATLAGLGYDNVTVRIGDGYNGWPEHAPFDAIVVTAAPEEVPQPLIEQLAPGGRLVAPVGPQGRTQWLRVIEKDADGGLTRTDVLPVIFVPFTRE